MDSNNLTSNNYSPNTEANNDNQSNGYTNNVNPENTYQNDGYQSGYTNNSYQNNGYQNGYQNNSYVNSNYQNNANPTSTYQNGYQNGYQNNSYQNDWYQNDYQNGYQNGYANNSYINNDKLLKTYKNFKQQAVNFMNTTLPADPTKRATAIIAIVLAVIIFGCISINAVTHYHNCSSEKIENIEEYFDCNPSISKTSDNDNFSTTFEPDGARLNITSKFKDHLSEYDIRRVEGSLGERLLLMEMLPFSNGVADKVKEPIHLYYTFLNDDGSVVYTDDFLYE